MLTTARKKCKYCWFAQEEISPAMLYEMLDFTHCIESKQKVSHLKLQAAW